MSWIERIAERKIQDAQGRGEFDDLEGAGQPLDLSIDPNVPPELRAACHLLRIAQFVPEWIELEREIDRREEQRVAAQRRFALRRERALAREQVGPAGLAALDRARDRFLNRAAEQLRELDALLERYNLIVPAVNRQRRRYRVSNVLRRLADTYPRFRSLPPGEQEPWELTAQREAPRPLRLAGRLPCRREATL